MTEKVMNEQSGQLEYQIKAVIRKKIMFITRPTPLKNNDRGGETEEHKRESKMRKLNE